MDSALIWVAVGSGATLAAVLLVLLGHMFAFARDQGARDERERQTTDRLKSLESRADTQAQVAADLTTQGALTAQSMGAIKQQFESGFANLTHQLERIGQDVSNILSGKIQPARRGKPSEEG